MRTTLLLPLLFFLMAFSARAQLSAGNLLLGGRLGFSLTHSKGPQQARSSTSFGIGLSPEVGFFVADNVVMGTMLSYGNGWGKSLSNDRFFSNSRHHGAGPFVRLYKMVSERAGFIGHAYFSYGKNQTRNIDTGWETSNSNSSITAGISPGFTYFVHDKIGIEFLLGGLSYYTFYGQDERGRSTGRSGGLGFSSGLGNAALGFRYYVNRQKK
jgi:hypothetical protein